MRAARVGLHRAVVWKRLYRSPSAASLSIVGEGTLPPKVLNWPKPASSIRMSTKVGASAGLTVKMFIGEAAAAYEVARWSGLFSPGSSTALDLYAGGRAWWQRGEVDLAV